MSEQNTTSEGKDVEEVLEYIDELSERVDETHRKVDEVCS